MSHCRKCKSCCKGNKKKKCKEGRSFWQHVFQQGMLYLGSSWRRVFCYLPRLEIFIKEAWPLRNLQRVFAFSFVILFNLEVVKCDHYLLLWRLSFSFSSVYSWISLLFPPWYYTLFFITMEAFQILSNFFCLLPGRKNPMNS